MSRVLFKAILKRNAKLIGGYGIGSSVYLFLMTLLYPSMKTTLEDKMDLIADMPEGVRAAFGLEQGGAIRNVTDYWSVQYYSLIFLVLMALFAMTFAAKYLARLVEQGSMAYFLSAPLTRRQVIVTMMAAYLTALFAMVAANLLFSVAGAYLVGETVGDWPAYLLLHAVGFMLFAAIGGCGFLFAAATGDERKAVAGAGALTLLFYVADTVGKLSESLAGLRYVSLFYWYRPAEILAGGGGAATGLLVLLAVGAACYAAAAIVFARKNLNL